MEYSDITVARRWKDSLEFKICSLSPFLHQNVNLWLTKDLMQGPKKTVPFLSRILLDFFGSGISFIEFCWL